jgi:SAM-dependent methyltransferase
MISGTGAVNKSRSGVDHSLGRSFMSKLIMRLTAAVGLPLILLVSAGSCQSREAGQGALAPEDANEALLNGLQPPDKVMDIIGLKPGMVAAEIGAGRGRFVMHFSVRVGESGKVFAEDIDAAALDHLKRRCDRWKLGNVETILGTVMDPKLPAGELDLIFVISSYHHFDDPTALMRNARPALRPGGVLAIAEWIPTSDRRGGTPPETVKSQVRAAGFDLVRTDLSLEANRLAIYLFRPRTD